MAIETSAADEESANVARVGTDALLSGSSFPPPGRAAGAEVAVPELQLQLPSPPLDGAPARNAISVQPSIDAMLADAVSKPALPTLTGAPPSVEKRALEQCLLALVRMNEEYRQRTID